MNARGPLLTTGLLAALVGFTQDRGRLIVSRCANQHTGDSTTSIRVTLARSEDRIAPLNLVLSGVRRDGSDSLVAIGVDSVVGVRRGFYRLWVRQIGYYHLRDTLRLEAGEAWCLTAHMIPEPIRLDRLP